MYPQTHFYEAACPLCKGAASFQRKDLEKEIDAEFLAQIDSGEASQLSVSSMTRTDSEGKQIPVPFVTCGHCQQIFPASLLARREYDITEIPASQQIMLDIEEAVVQEETDPLMVALEKTKNQCGKDPTHPEIGTYRLQYQLRCLIQPVHAFLRVFLFRNFDHHIDGTVSVYKLPAHAHGKSNPFSSGSITDKFRSLVHQMLPLALAPDMPCGIFTPTLILFLWISTRLIMDYCVVFPSSSTTEESSSSSSTTINAQQDSDYEIHVRKLTPIIFILCALGIYFQIRTLIREPGYVPRGYYSKKQKSSGHKNLASSAAGGSGNISVEEEEGEKDEIEELLAASEAIQNVNITATSGNNSEENNNNAATATSSSSPKSKSLSKKEDDGWCEVCQHMRPPRVIHCRLCGLCSDMNDHHCLWIAACIGKRNALHFFWFCVCVSLGSVLNFIQLLLFMLLATHKLTLGGWIYGVFILFIQFFVAQWTLFMAHRHTYNQVLNGISLREASGEDFRNAGVPKAHKIGTLDSKDQWRNIVKFFTQPVPKSRFAEEFDNEEEMNK